MANDKDNQPTPTLEDALKQREDEINKILDQNPDMKPPEDAKWWAASTKLGFDTEVSLQLYKQLGIMKLITFHYRRTSSTKKPARSSMMHLERHLIVILILKLLNLLWRRQRAIYLAMTISSNSTRLSFRRLMMVQSIAFATLSNPIRSRINRLHQIHVSLVCNRVINYVFFVFFCNNHCKI